MADDMTTIQVRRASAEKLAETGLTMANAVQQLLEVCSHPEKWRKYTTAMLPEEGQTTISFFRKTRTVMAFECGICGCYVVPNAKS